jgi:predicted phosphodiesterase
MRVGVIGDMHVPFEKIGYVDFLKQVFKEYKVDTVVCIGDLVDNHAVSYHEADPDGLSSGDEVDEVMHALTYVYKTFPDVTMLLGNHDKLPERKAKTAGLSNRFIKSFSEMWRTPKGWDIYPDYVEIDGVHYTHGTGLSGRNAAINLSLIKGQSVVMGHVHSFGGVQYRRNKNGTFFGLNVGCGVDEESYAMEYAKAYVHSPTLGCGVVVDGKEGFFIPMEDYDERLA